MIMSYFDQRYPGQTSLSGSCCSGCATGASKCLGDDTDLSKIGTPKAATSDDLRAQLNRFASGDAPTGYKLFPTELPGSGPLDTSVAARVGVVLMKRMSEPGAAVDPKFATLTAQIMADVTGAALTANLAYVTSMVAGYGDAHGLPNASGGTIFGIPTVYVLVGGAALAAIMMLKKGARRG
jgi:hypothetical protein